MEKGNILRNLTVLAQRNDLQKMERQRNMVIDGFVETVFSCIKRMFGEYVYSVRT